MQNFDVIILGAGASGLFCGGLIAKAGLKVLIIEHNSAVGKKIKISGGGRCNFTNIHTSSKQFISQKDDFCHYALTKFSAVNFISWIKQQKIAFYEKHKGQLFCKVSSQQLIDALLKQCTNNGATVVLTEQIQSVEFNRQANLYNCRTNNFTASAKRLVVATGGLSIPKIGASDLGYKIAKQFSLAVQQTAPALVPLVFDKQHWQPFVALAGLSLTVDISVDYQGKKVVFNEDLLFTHRGLSGPAILQISSYWQIGKSLSINLLPKHSVTEIIQQAKQQGGKRKIANILAPYLPNRLIASLLQTNMQWQRYLAETSKTAIQSLDQAIHNWQLEPVADEGYKKAEVTRGGVSVTELHKDSMQSKKQHGLYFIGEVVDVTGWLGGYNFQWAWSSAYVCAQAIIKDDNS